MNASACGILTAGLMLAGVLSGCGASYPARTGSSASQAIQAESLKGDLQELLDRASARDDVMMKEADKAQNLPDKVRLTKQAYYEAYASVNRIRDRADAIGLNPFEAKNKKAVLEEADATIWKLRFLEKEGSPKAADDEARLALYEQLHTEAVASLTRVQNILKARA